MAFPCLKRVAFAVVASALLGGLVTPVQAQAPRIPPSDVTRPANTKPFTGDAAKLLATGTQRHGDTRLSPIGRSCNTCHAAADSYNETFNKPWPHFVESVKEKTGLDTITAEGMVQFCMISAMQTRPLPWDSETLAALTAFVLARHKKVANLSRRYPRSRTHAERRPITSTSVLSVTGSLIR